MSQANYQNSGIFSTETTRFNTEKFNSNSKIEDIADLLVSKTLAEANAEEILDIVLNNAFDAVCPHIPNCIQLSNKDVKPIVTTPSQSNILSVLEMQNNLPVIQKTVTNFHSGHSCETCDEEKLEEPVFTSPIYVKSGPENINILEEMAKPVSSTKSECTSSKGHQLYNFKNSADLQDVSPENTDRAEVISLEKENNRMLCYNSESKINIDCHACTNMNSDQIKNRDNVEFSANIGDANGMIDNTEKHEDNEKVSSTDLNGSAVSQIIGDVIRDLPGSVKDLDTHPQVVQAYVLYPDNPAPGGTTAKNENTLTTEMEGDSIEQNKEVNTTASSNEIVDVERRLMHNANDVGDIIDYFQEVSKAVDVGVSNVDSREEPGDKSSNESMESSSISEDVKRAVQDIAAVLEGQGDGTPNALSAISVQLTDQREDNSPTTPQPTASMLNTDAEEEIAVHESFDDDDDEAELQNFLSEMHKQDEVEEKEVQVILHSDDEDIEIYTDDIDNETVYDSDPENPCFSEYLASARSRTHSPDDLNGITYRSFSGVELSPSRPYIDPSKLKCVVEEIYSLEKMQERMQKNNPKLKTRLTIEKRGTRVHRQVCQTNVVDDNALKSEEDTPDQGRDTKWSRLRKFFACGALKCSTQISDEPQNM